MRLSEKMEGHISNFHRTIDGFLAGLSHKKLRKAVEALNARAHWIHVVPYDGAWTFKHEHGEPEGTFRTQKQAIEAARAAPTAHP